MNFKKNRIITFSIILSLITLALFYKGYLRFNYPSKSEFPIQGIDISNHQKDINWKEINNNEIRFVYIKATEGGDFKDARFKVNWEESKKHKFNVGAYHFFTFCKSGREQAKNFIETVPIDESNLPPVIDLEYGGNCKNNKNRNEIIAEIDTLQKLMYQTYKKTPILYVTEEFYEDYLINEFVKNPIWYRDVFKKPNPKGNREWLIWQFANRGHLKGIDTYVDFNVFNGSENDFLKFIQ